MRFLIITSAKHYEADSTLFSYAPYVREMNLWLAHVAEVVVMAPLDRKSNINDIHLGYEHDALLVEQVPSFDLTSVMNSLRTLFVLPFVIYKMFMAIRKADHVHLRCPSNMGLLACILLVFFRKKKKTAKYAGNWDPNSKQPWSYRLQKRLLSNPTLLNNMKVIVYGKWPDQTANVMPFFTATYQEHEKEPVAPRDFAGKIRCMFVGTLSPGKQPIKTVEVIQRLREKGYDATLDMFGDGKLRPELESYLQEHGLESVVTLHGNQTKGTVRSYYKKSHFLLLLSKSEGWPKVIAESMFWGCVPVGTTISCVPYMLDHGNRGVLVAPNEKTVEMHMISVIGDEGRYNTMSDNAMQWSRIYTIEKFSTEIAKLV